MKHLCSPAVRCFPSLDRKSGNKRNDLRCITCSQRWETGAIDGVRADAGGDGAVWISVLSLSF